MANTDENLVHMVKTSIHKGTSQSWGESSCARLCGIIMESNTSIAQQIMENRTDLLDLYTKEQLEEHDDIGLSIQFLAIHYDRPEILQYLHKRGLDLNAPCDPMNFGNPMFYAVRLKKHRLIRVLDLLGCSIDDPCDPFKHTASDHADRLNDDFAKREIEMAQSKEYRAAVLFRKNFLKVKYSKLFRKKVTMATRIQKMVRGMIGRRLGAEKKEEMELWRALHPDGVDDTPKKKHKKKKPKDKSSKDKV